MRVENGGRIVPPIDSPDYESRFGMMLLTPVNCGETTFGAVIIHTINLTLSLRFGEVGVMNPNLILELRVNCESHLRVMKE